MVGAISSLVVTTLGGVAVYYLTKEPEIRSKELLTYSVRSSGVFSGEKERVAFTSISIENHGGKPASNVIANITSGSSSIKDLTTSNSDGTLQEKKVTSNKATLKYAKLLPGETLTIDVLLDSPVQPRILVRSDESLAVSEATLGASKTEKRQEVNKLASLLVPTSAIVILLLTPIVFRILRRARKLEKTGGLIGDRNNAAFLLLHSGLSEEAEEVLNAAVRAGRYDSFTFSNLAVANAVNGKTDKASALMVAANYLEVEGHAAGVIAFNEALLYFMSGKRPEAIAALRRALALSPKDVKKYCERSVLLSSYRRDADFIALVDSA